MRVIPVRASLPLARTGLVGAGIMGSDHASIFATEIPGAKVQVIRMHRRTGRAMADA